MRRFLILSLAGLLLLAACGDITDVETTAAAGTSAPMPPTIPPPVVTTAASPPSSVAPATTIPAFPITVEGDSGRVTVQARPERIVSLSASHTEMLYALDAGSQIAGTDLTSNYPADAETTAKVDAFNFDIEEVAALDPDLVILAFDFTGELDALDAVGIPALLLGPAATLEDVYRQIDVVGTATGHQAEAAALVSLMREEVAEALGVPGPDAAGRSVYHEVDSTLYSASSATLLGDIYAAFGLVNIADEVPDEFGSGFPQLSAEFVVESDPDIIFLGDVGFGESAETVAGRPGWDALTAVQSGAIVELDPDVSGRWGPRTSRLVTDIANAVAELVQSE